MELLDNLDKVHTTERGVDRIKRNIGVDVEDIVKYCIDKIKQEVIRQMSFEGYGVNL